MNSLINKVIIAHDLGHWRIRTWPRYAGLRNALAMITLS